MKIDKNNDFERVVICKHGKLSRLINIHTQEHQHISLLDLIKMTIWKKTIEDYIDEPLEDVTTEPTGEIKGIAQEDIRVGQGVAIDSKTGFIRKAMSSDFCLKCIDEFKE